MQGVAESEANRQECLDTAAALNIPISQVGTPFIVVEQPDGTKSALIGEDEVLEHFRALEQEIRNLNV
jgi:hypothetical protein